MISLFSDTGTIPSPGMRKAIYEARVGDEQKFEDPTVNELLVRTASLLGKPAALFLPSGTMCNLIAVKTHTRHGDLVYADQAAHIVRSEAGGMAMLAGVMVETLESDAGIFSAEQLKQGMCRTAVVPLPWRPQSCLVCVEQTHNFGGGTVWDTAQLKEVYEHAHANGCVVHMDGARIGNAAAAKGVEAREFTKWTDSVWTDFSKGLGAPFGAVLAGTCEFIEAARRYKHALGGAMRQAGIMAAACVYALDNNLGQLAEDNANAAKFARGLSKIKGICVKNDPPDSNIVLFDALKLGIGNSEFVERLLQAGVETSVLGNCVRAVTHLDVSSRQIDEAVGITEAATR